MFLNKFPEVISFDMDGEQVEAYVMFISQKYVHSGDEGGENFVAVCYDKDNVIYEVFLNDCKLIKARDERKSRSTRRTVRAGGRKRPAHDGRRDNNTFDKEDYIGKREGGTVRFGYPGEADASENQGHSIL